MKRIAVLSCVFVLLAGASVQAQEDRQPPRAVFKQEGVRQVGRLGTYCWSWMDEAGEGGGKCVDYFRHVWPRVKAALKGEPSRITLRYPDMPEDGSLTYWRRVDEDKQPVGEGTEVPYTATPREGQPGTVWDLTFDAPDYRGHFYLYGFFAWSGKGDASYHWHLTLN